MESHDQNKIKGKEVAVARAKYGEKEDGKEGYILQTNDGGLLDLIDPLEKDSLGITEESMMDCIKQIEDMGSFEDLSKEYNSGQGQERQSPGIVVVSKTDPRIMCSMEFGSDWQKDTDAQFHKKTAADVTFKFFVDVYNEEANMGNEAKGERDMTDDELEMANQLGRQEESRMMNLLKSGSRSVLIEGFNQNEIDIMGEHESVMLGEETNKEKTLIQEDKGDVKMESNKGFDDFGSVDFFGMPRELSEADISGHNQSTGFSDLKDSDLMVDSPQKKQKEVDAKESALKGDKDPNKVGDVLEKPASELKGDNKPVSEGDLKDSEIKVGKPGEDHGDHVEGKGTSDDQQKELPASEVKVGKPGEDHGKHMEESIDKQIKARMRKRVEEAKARKKIAESRKLSVKSTKLNEDEEKKPEEKPDMDLEKMKEAYGAKMQEAEDLKKKIDDMESVKECGEMPTDEQPAEVPPAAQVSVEAPAEEEVEMDDEKKEKKTESSKVMSDAARKKMQQFMKKKHESKK